MWSGPRLSSRAARDDGSVRALALAALVLALGVAGCAPRPEATPRASAPTKATHPPLYRGNVLDYAPAAGLSWLLILRPERILRNATAAPNLARLIPEERWKAFEAATGIRVRDVPSAAVASYGLGTLYLAELPPGFAPVVRERFALRVTTEPILSRPRPGLERIRGTAGGLPRSLVTLDDRLLAIAARDTTLTRIVEAYALGKLKSPSALRGAALSDLPPLADDVLAAFYAPGPFEDEWANAGGGLLAASTAVQIVVSDAGDGEVRATLTLIGDFEFDAEPDQRLERAFRDLVESPTGKLLALERASDTRVAFRAPFLTLTTNLPLEPIARGLRAAVIADVWEILELSPTSREPDEAVTP
jgi:hypothetical protein